MIRFKMVFMVYDGINVHISPKIKINLNFWGSFLVESQLIMCNIIYLGNDVFMKQNTWYPGIIELPYGEKFYNDNLSKSELLLETQYYLHCADNNIGLCILKDLIDLRKGIFDIKKDEYGNY